MFRSFKSHTIIIDTFQRTKLNFTMCFMLHPQLSHVLSYFTYFTTVGIFLGVSIMQETLKNIIHSEFFVGD